jgi:hypothetical protein
MAGMSGSAGLRRSKQLFYQEMNQETIQNMYNKYTSVSDRDEHMTRYEIRGTGLVLYHVTLSYFSNREKASKLGY